MLWPWLVFFCLMIWWSSLQISQRALPPLLANVPTLPNYSKYSTVLETTHAIKTRAVSKSGFLLPRQKTSNFATVQSFTGLYDSKLSTCHRSKTKLSSLLSLLKSSDFLLLLMLTLIISIISCWWITTSIGLDLPSAFNCIVLNRFHHKKIVLTILSAFTL